MTYPCIIRVLFGPMEVWFRDAMWFRDMGDFESVSRCYSRVFLEWLCEAVLEVQLEAAYIGFI